MSSTGLFGHLVTQFATSPENLATESLHYILQSATARQAVTGFLAQAADLELDQQYTFRTQVGGSDSAIPDLVGFDSRGQQSLIVEAKFWAGLTDKQPTAYLERLPANTPSALVFLAPAQRLDILWGELLRRCQAAGLEYRITRSAVAEVRAAALGPSRSLVLLSWRRLLAFVQQELVAAAEEGAAADVAQLQGLCERMDSDAYLPVHAEDLTSDVPWRILQYGQLIDELTEVLFADGLVSITGRRATGGSGWFGRTTDVGEFVLFIGFNAEKWAELASTPLWLSLYGPKWTMPTPATRVVLSPLEVADPPRLYVEANHLTIPLFIPTGVEHAEIVSSLVAQTREVLGLLPSVG